VTSFTIPAKEFRLTSESLRLLNAPSIVHKGWRHTLIMNGRGDRVISYMIYRGQRCGIDKNGAPNMIGGGWVWAVNMTNRSG
jgi:hypothetical protein